MAIRLGDLWTTKGPLSRSDYAKWGVLLFAIKYNLDRLLSGLLFHEQWYPWTYLVGTHGTPRTALVVFLLGLSLPFICWGVLLTLRRLRDAGWPPGLVALFFVPFLNLLFFAFLCVQPARGSTPAEPRQDGWRGWVYPESKLGSAALGVVVSVVLGSALAMLGTMFLRDYGWGLFVGIPFMMGMTSALLFAAVHPRTAGECIAVGLLSVGLASFAVIALAVEGLVCVVMAAPIAGVIALLGSLVGYWIQIERWSRSDFVRLHAAGWLALPLLMSTEAKVPRLTAPVAVTTVCEIAAAPAAVWKHVIAFSELPPPTEAIFRAGIAYPIRARLEGHGVGAVRYCEFSTGPFVEPITAWDENRRLAFDVVVQPHPMTEWSPYRGLRPAHLEGFFRSRRGEFRLSALPGGGTRLEGTTWYEQDIWPKAYWQPWSDYLLHAIHQRVLQHIRTLAEAGPTASLPN